MASDCIFCKIGSGEIEGDVLDHDDRVLVLRDMSPQAPLHLLIMPFEHIATVADLDDSHAYLVGRMVSMANRMAVQEGVAERGYRLAINCREEGGQSVDHLHMHLLGGRQLSGTLG